LTGGEIIVDGLDIAHVPLQALRRNICIIPQQPFLMSGIIGTNASRCESSTNNTDIDIGTIRMNLDPFNNHSDDAIWNALAKVHLKTTIENLPNQLLTEVVERGKITVDEQPKMTPI